MSEKERAAAVVRRQWFLTFEILGFVVVLVLLAHDGDPVGRLFWLCWGLAVAVLIERDRVKLRELRPKTDDDEPGPDGVPEEKPKWR